jgi:hypothetical protein
MSTEQKGTQENKEENLIFDYSDKTPVKPSPQRTGTRATDKMLIGGVLGIVLLFAAVLGYIYWKSHQRPLTIEELHQRNLKGELDPELGYVYKDVYSFIKRDDFWYTALTSQSGRTLYNFAFRYPPHELEDVPVTGKLDEELFNNAREYYITFTPTEDNLSYTVLAVNDYNQHMLNAFQKTPIPACDRNETAPCWSRPIVTCDNVNRSRDVVVYIQNSPQVAVVFEGNCIMLKGEGFGQVKAVDRLLYHFYNIME